MVSIAIVDDDILICATIDEFLRKKLCFQQISISDFSNGKELIDALENGESFDIIFMDVYMQPINGYDAGLYIRQNFASKNVFLVYISTRTENLIPFFALHPFDYIEKPVSTKKLDSLIDRIMSCINTEKDRITIRVHSKDILLNLSSIIYATTLESHRVKIIIIDGEPIVFYGKLSELYDALNAITDCIVQIHKSYIINLNHIKSMSRTSVELQHVDTPLPISQKYQHQISDIYYKYINSKDMD